MATLQSRLRILEQTSGQNDPLLLYAPNGELTAEQAAQIAEAKEAGRAVVLASRHDAEI